MPISDMKSPSKNVTDEKWQSVLTGLSATLGLEIPERAAAAMGDIAATLPDASPLKFVSSDADLQTVTGGNHPYWAVEPLMQQATVLLDRALETDQKHFALAVQQFNARLEVTQFLALDAIHKDEIAAHLYDLPGMEAQADLDVLKSHQASKAELDANYATILNHMDDATFQRLKLLAQDLAYQNIDMSKNSFANIQVSVLGYDPKTTSFRGVIPNDVVEQFEKTFPVQQAQHHIEERQYRLQMEDLGLRQDSVEKKATYYRKDADFKSRRREVALGIMASKYDAMSTTGGALDYDSQLKELAALQRTDVSEAYSRLLAIQRGIKVIYGFDVDHFPEPWPFSLQKAVTWLRAAHAALSYYALWDQPYVQRISLRSELGDAAFDTGIGSGWKLMLPQKLFAGLSIRLRGIAAYAVDSGGGFYDLEFQLPGITTPMPADQRSVPPCWVRGVRSRAIAYQPEIHAPTAVYNLSPIGTWEIKLGDRSVAEAKSRTLRDVELDLYLVAG